MAKQPSLGKTVASSDNIMLTPTVASHVPIEESFSPLSPQGASEFNTRDTVGRRVRRVLLGSALLILAVAGAGSVGIAVTSGQADKLTAVYSDVRAANDAMMLATISSSTAASSFLLTNDTGYITELKAASVKINSSLISLQQQADKVDDPGLIQLVQESNILITTLLELYTEQTTPVKADSPPEANPQLIAVQVVSSLRENMGKVIQSLDEANAKSVKSAAKVRQQTIIVSLLIIFVTFIIIIFTIVNQGADVANPLVNMSHVANKIYQGYSGQRAEVSVGPTEIRVIGHAINDLAQQQENAEEHIKRIRFIKSNFINTVNHELRTPLTSITGFAEMLASNTENVTKEKREGWARVIMRNNTRLAGLIDNVLTVLRMDNNDVHITLKNHDIRKMIKESIEQLESDAQLHDIKIITDIGIDPIMVMSDSEEMLRILNNFVSNAVKFSLPDGEIKIGARSEINKNGKSEAVITIQDFGIGIVKTDMPHIGTRFFRSSNAIAGAIQGSGLGLMIADYLMRAHGGTWSIESLETSGTLVTMRLPISHGIIKTK
jgi:signal transduction histidine kinase